MPEITIHNRPNRPYKLLPYNPAWKTNFEIVSKELTPLFGTNLLNIEHVGSTAIPGMLAKPQIDLLIVVQDLNKVKKIYPVMTEHGFQPMGNFIQKSEPEEYFVKDNEMSERLFSVHVMQEGNQEIADMIVLRDYLRADEQPRQSYINHKQKLMQEYSDKDYNSYGKGKVEFLEELKAKARVWFSVSHV